MKISVCSSEKPAQLRYLYDKISVNVRGLTALGIKLQQYSSLLIPIIMARLPPEIRIHDARHTSQDIWEIEALLDLLQHKIEARKISEKIKAVTLNATTPPRQQQISLGNQEMFHHPPQLEPFLSTTNHHLLHQHVFTALKSISPPRAKMSPK